MAQLNWNNISAPDFSAAMEGMDRFGNHLNSAFTAMRGGLNDFKISQEEQANRRALLESSALTTEADALAYNESLLNRKGANYLSADTIKATADRPNQLIDTEGKRLVNTLTGEQIVGAGIANTAGQFKLDSDMKDRIVLDKRIADQKGGQKFSARLYTANRTADPVARAAAEKTVFDDPEFQEWMKNADPTVVAVLLNDPLNFNKNYADLYLNDASIKNTNSQTGLNNANSRLVLEGTLPLTKKQTITESFQPVAIQARANADNANAAAQSAATRASEATRSDQAAGTNLYSNVMTNPKYRTPRQKYEAIISSPIGPNARAWAENQFWKTHPNFDFYQQ